jgi:hypothetical protein
MFNMIRVLQDIVRRISLGEAVYVKMEYRDEVSEELEKAKVAYIIEAPKNDPRVLFRPKKRPATHFA